jgi:hypothetical protein
MTLTMLITINLLADAAIAAGLAFVMSQATRLRMTSNAATA